MKITQTPKIQSLILASALSGQVAAIGSPIPEPETSAMLLAGLGLLGFIASRRKAA